MNFLLLWNIVVVQTKKTGWQPHHLLVYDQQTLVAIMPLFIKTHSYGEYVFDWSWANAYHQHGLEYYPKLLNGIPFTPATGPRWGIHQEYNLQDILAFLSSTINEELSKLQASSCHCLFPEKALSDQLTNHHSLQRTGYQYHWFNDNYQSFDDFTATMSSRKRKNINKERRKIQEQNISIHVKCGDDITEQDWQNFYLFYQITYLKRSGQQGYLSPSFFPILAKTMSEHLVMTLAYYDQQPQPVAAALCFKDSETLYGRYWGCKENFDSLHFETCYYQGIEYAIKYNLKRFDPGAQGEHKIQRGFTPIKTYSNHWISHQDFKDAIERFITMEQKEVDRYLVEASTLLPFKQS